MKTIAVSGCSGFIGNALLNELKDKKYKIIPIDIKIGTDLSDWNSVKNIPSFDLFIHLANLTYVPDSYKDPLKFYHLNYLTTLHALELCRKYNAKCIYLSSYIYGTPDYLPIDEKHVLKPFNPYAQTKYINESLCQAYFRDFDVITTILRPFNIYGPFQKGEMLIPTIIKKLKQNKKSIQLKDSSPRRDYVYITDVVKAILYCMNLDFKEVETYNVCSGKSYSVLEMTAIINSFFNNKIEFSFGVTDRKNEIDETVGSYKKINKKTGWVPDFDFKDGMKHLLVSEGII